MFCSVNCYFSIVPNEHCTQTKQYICVFILGADHHLLIHTLEVANIKVHGKSQPTFFWLNTNCDLIIILHTRMVPILN
jgi:hypothetical protein